MSGIASTLARGGRQRGSRLAVSASTPSPCHRRSTSWIAWEQPNPSLYAPPPQASISNETQKAASKAQFTRNVGEAVTAPATAAVSGGSQEVSTSGKTVPLSIQAGASRVPFSQTRGSHSKTKPEKDPYLPTTLIRIPGETVTWPVEVSEHPDQPRVRKLRTVHKNEGPIRKDEASFYSSAPKSKDAKPQDTTERHMPHVTSNVAIGLDALEQNHSLARSIISFEDAIKKYMAGVQTREEALARAKELDAARQEMDEKDRDEWHRIVKEALETSIYKAESKGMGGNEGDAGAQA
ncbi:hypothetical protein F4776DRAFT_660655 [Hypoxylon sp. NC0597]|nr:hypothetical protein F4776DRAFT_660655 [Hypoxylon sp. NC0597]